MEINNIENKKAIENINKTKNWQTRSKKVNKID